MTLLSIMTKQNYQHKKTCFYCKYEIINHKAIKHILYKGNKKVICQHCTKFKHKTLEAKYSQYDVQCTTCDKPVMYKKCIACSICDHFIHGKCNNLNKEDIKKIEMICDFFICRQCSNEIFPNVEALCPKTKNKTQNCKLPKNVCLVCNDTITKQQYSNKNIIYNEKEAKLCYKCSMLGTNIPVRDKHALEFLDCPICSKQVKYESIYCNHCQHWVHPQCNLINRQKLSELNNLPDDWYCLKCNLNIFPNQLLNTITIKKSKFKDKVILEEFKTFKDCTICFKLVSGHETLSCSDCRHWIHKKCIGNFSNRIEFQSFLHYYSNKPWDCPLCLSEKLPFVLLDDEEFHLLLLENNINLTIINKDDFHTLYTTLNNQNFLNHSKDEDEKDRKYLPDIDPDNFANFKDTCNYTIDTESIKIKTTKELVMMTFNIRSLRKNFDNFTYLLSRIKTKIHIICLTETWLNNNDNLLDYELDGYHPPLNQTRSGNKHGGGVITYIHRDINKHKLNKSLCFVDEFNHCLATDVTIDNKTISILNIYRSPTYLNDKFLYKYEEIIEKVKTRLCYALGDYNFNLINIDKHTATEDYYNLMISNSFKTLITKPTRITQTNKTLIDHIWTNDLRSQTIIESHIIITDITDHLPCISVVKNSDLHIKGYKNITTRIINDNSRQSFNNKISETRHALAFHVHNRHETDLNKKYEDYFDHIKRIYNEHFPVITKKVHSKTYSKPWITPDVQKLIDKKNYRYSKKFNNNSKSNRTKFKEAKKIMEYKIVQEKDSYYKNLLENNTDNLRQRWNAIRTIINRRKAKPNDCIIPANTLGKHYATVAEKLASKLPQLTKNDIPSTSKHNLTKVNKIKQTNKPSFNFREVSDREVYENILKLDSNKGPGVDGIDTKTLKSIADIISPHLSSLFNQSIKEGVYPQCLKIAKCVPVYKGTPLDSSQPVNYRPISILTAVNKIFERTIHDQMSIYLEDNHLLPTFQYGYRKQHNTSQAVLDFIDTVTKACNQKLVTIAVFMDLSKAFDTVDKNILDQKLEELGLTIQCRNLLMSYMNKRQFCMSNDHETYYNLAFGVPQGSILGPLLFIMYISDMTEITKRNKTIVYADDTTVLISGRNLTEAKQHCNDILTRFFQYFTLNKLSINPSKTKYMIYTPRARTSSNRKKCFDTNNIELMMNDSNLEQVKSIRFLGVIINDRLTWESHKKHVHNKISKTLGILYKCKYAMKEVDVIKMYKAFIQPYFLYAMEVWGHTINSESDILVRLQSKALRIVLNCKRSEDAWKHNKNRIAPLQTLYESVIKRLCLKQHANMLPKYFADNIMPDFNLSQLQNKITRTSLNQMYDYKTVKHFNSTNFKTNCIKIWNSQSLEFKSTPYISTKTATYKTLSSLSHSSSDK